MLVHSRLIGYLTGSFVLQSMFYGCTCLLRVILILTTDVVSKSGILVPVVDSDNGQMNCCSEVEVAALSVLSFSSSSCCPRAVPFSFVTKLSFFLRSCDRAP